MIVNRTSALQNVARKTHQWLLRERKRWVSEVRYLWSPKAFISVKISGFVLLISNSFHVLQIFALIWIFRAPSNCPRNTEERFQGDLMLRFFIRWRSPIHTENVHRWLRSCRSSGFSRLFYFKTNSHCLRNGSQGYLTVRSAWHPPDINANVINLIYITLVNAQILQISVFSSAFSDPQSRSCVPVTIRLLLLLKL